MAAHRGATGLQIPTDTLQVRTFEVVDRREVEAPQLGILLRRLRQGYRIDALAQLEIGIVQVVLGLVHDVDMKIAILEVWNLTLGRLERDREVIHVILRQSHPQHDRDARNLPQLPKGLELAPIASLDPANVVVHRLVPIRADRDHQLLGAHAGDLSRITH